MNPHLTWNLVADVRQVLQFPFMVNALRAGTVVAVTAGVAGYLMVVRRQTFAGHTLAVIGFPGAATAIWVGADPVAGFYGSCVVGAVAIAAFAGEGGAATRPGGAGEHGPVIATVQAFALAAGMLFVSLYHGFSSGLTDLLFGTITGVTPAQVRDLVVAGAVTLAGLAVLGRPLLFATVDPDAARARGVPVRAVGTAYLLLLGIVAAGTSQVTGSLLVFALLVAPAATAARLTARPGAGVAISVGVALLVAWLGEGVAYFSPYPVGFWVTTFGFAAFLGASALRWYADRRGRLRVATGG